MVTIRKIIWDFWALERITNFGNEVTKNYEFLTKNKIKISQKSQIAKKYQNILKTVTRLNSVNISIQWKL